MSNWKVIGGSAVFAFILSFIVGAVSSVSFGLILLRALIGAGAFGGIAFGAIYIIKQYLPDLGATLSLETEDRPEEGGIDIVIEDEHPPQPKPKSTESNESTEDESIVVPEGLEAETADEVESDSNGNTFVEEVEETGGSIGSDVEEVEPIEEEVKQIDSLPDIGDMSDSFTFSSEEEEDSYSEESSDTPSIDINGEQQDPRVIAKAVQTMMKKD